MSSILKQWDKKSSNLPRMEARNYVYGEILKSEASKLIDLLGIGETSTVIDIGSGNARFLCEIMKQSGCNGIGVEIKKERHLKAIARRSLKGLGAELELKNDIFPCELNSKYTHAILHACAWDKKNTMEAFRNIPKGVKIIHNSFSFNKEYPRQEQTMVHLKTSYLTKGSRFWYFKK